MSKSKLIILFFLLSTVFVACGPGQLFGPTLPPTPSATPTYTPTPTPTFTPTATNTPVPTATSTPLPGLGITDSDLVSWAKDFDYTLHEITFDGLPARKYVSPEGYTTLTLVGTPPYLERVILEINEDRENSAIATLTWIYVLEIASNYAGKPAADWVRDNYPRAVQSGREAKIFKDANIVLEADGSIFRLIVEPAAK